MTQQKISIHHSIKLITTVIFSTVVISFGKYEIMKVMQFMIFPAILFAYSNVSLKTVLRKLMYLEPLILGIGILNPLFEKETIAFLNFDVSIGWISLISLVLRSTLILVSTIILSQTIQLEEAMIGLKMPSIFVTQISLTYRYIGLLSKEIKSVLLAYRLRSSDSKGINFRHMGSVLGHFFIRTLDKAMMIHHAMMLRGFDGQRHGMVIRSFQLRDFVYLLFWTFVFVMLRLFTFSDAIGRLIVGGVV